jgi:hypothetical protein
MKNGKPKRKDDVYSSVLICLAAVDCKFEAQVAVNALPER